MMMQRSHLENTLFAELVAANLQNDGDRFQDEDSADEGEEEFLLYKHCDGADGSAEREGAYVAHEDLCRVGVVPEETDTCTDHCATENCELSDLGHALQLEIVRK